MAKHALQIIIFQLDYFMSYYFMYHKGKSISIGRKYVSLFSLIKFFQLFSADILFLMHALLNSYCNHFNSIQMSICSVVSVMLQ